MNTTISVQNRIWLPLVAAGTALALSVGLLTFVVLQQQTGEPVKGEPITRAVPGDVPQAKWAVKTSVGGAKRIPKKLAARAEHRAEEAAGVIQGLFDALFLDPAGAGEVIGKTFSRPAAQALRNPGIGLPNAAERVETTRRGLVVTVYAGSGEQAVARARVDAKGFAEGKPFEVRHESVLWLERTDGEWRIIAFEIDQRP